MSCLPMGGGEAEGAPLGSAFLLGDQLSAAARLQGKGAPRWPPVVPAPGAAAQHLRVYAASPSGLVIFLVFPR